MNYKTNSGYEVLYPKTNSDQIQMSDGSGNLNDNFQEVYNYRACNLGDIVGDSINSDFINKIGDSFLSCDGSILATSDYPEMEDYIVGTPYNNVEQTSFSSSGNGLYRASGLVEGENNRIIAFGTKNTGDPYNYGLYISDDNGKNFTLKLNLGVKRNFDSYTNSGIKLNDNSICFFIDGKRYISYNNGDSFSEQQINNFPVTTIQRLVVLPNNRIALLNNWASGKFYYSDDIGINWSVREVNSLSNMKDLFYYKDTLYLLSEGGKIRINRSLDYGNSWDSGIDSSTSNNSNYLSFLYVYKRNLSCFSYNTLFVLQGNSFVEQTINNPANLGNLNSKQIYTKGTLTISVIGYSMDGGLNWVTKNNKGDQYIVLQNSRIYSLEDNGNNYYSSIDKSSFQIPNIPNHYIRVK